MPSQLVLTDVLRCRSNHESAQHKSIDTVARTVRTMPIDFHSGPFHHMCPEGIDLIKGLLERDPAKRLDVYQVTLFLLMSFLSYLPLA